MNTIKLRAYHTELKEMFPVRTYDVYGSIVCFVTREQYEKYKDSEYGVWAPSEVVFGQSYPEKVKLMLYTGIWVGEGKKEKEIFESDIVELSYVNRLKAKARIAVITWLEHKACFKASIGKDFNANFGNDKKYKVKLLGNIYDNPDLLK